MGSLYSLLTVAGSLSLALGSWRDTYDDNKPNWPSHKEWPTPRPSEYNHHKWPTKPQKTPRPTHTPRPTWAKTPKPTYVKTPRPTKEPKTPRPTEWKTPRPTKEDKTPKPTKKMNWPSKKPTEDYPQWQTEKPTKW